MLDTLLRWETPLFLWLNRQHSRFGDEFMWIITMKWTWLPMVLLLITLLFYKTSWRQAMVLLLTIVISVTVADQVSDAVIKPYFQRLRPSYHPALKELVHIVNGYRGGVFGFVSSHAANSFALAVLLHLAMPTRLLSTTVFIWASLSSYSRIYLGVHFVSDVVCGALLGASIGYVCYQVYLLVRWQLLNETQPKNPFIPARNVNLFALAWCAYLMGIVVYSLAVHSY